MKHDLVGYFALPGRILTFLAPADYITNPWSILFFPGVEFSFPGEACSPSRKKSRVLNLTEKFQKYVCFYALTGDKQLI